MTKVQKSNNSANSEQILHTDVSVLIPASPELLECIQHLKSASEILYDWANRNPQMAKECFKHSISEIADPIDEAAISVSEVLRYEMIENIYPTLKSA